MAGELPVQRTFATARSVEFDALLVAGAPVPAPDAPAARDAAPDAIDPRVLRLVEECLWQGKVIGAWGSGTTVLEAADATSEPGVVAAKSGPEALDAATELLAAHRVWERFAILVPSGA